MTQNVAGLGSLKQVADIHAKYNAQRILLVTGKSSFSKSGAKAVFDSVLKNHQIVRFDDFEVNPKIEDAERGVELARESGIDLIIGVGGGSVMDMAKLIKAFYATPEMSREIARGETSMTDPEIPMVLIPTTAGSGSEATHFAVVYIGTDKFSLASQSLLPEAVILDGSLIASGSAYQKACNGLDALSQAIESAWAAGSTQESRAYAFKGLALCAENLKKVVLPQADPSVLQDMMVAANLAGKAINISKTTAAHAWSYGFTSRYGVPHGHAVWLTLPKIFEIHALAAPEDITDPRGADHLKMVIGKLISILNIESVDRITADLTDYLSEIGVDGDIAASGADSTDERSFLSKQVNMQRMANNPVRLRNEHINYVFNL